MRTEIGKTKKCEAEAVAKMYEEGRKFLRASGVNQWQDDYPALQDVWEDIEAGASYLLKAEGCPVASMAIVDREPTYDKIYEGEWLTGDSRDYLAVHRVCVSEAFRRRGLTRALYAYAEKIVLSRRRKSLRADTHKDNKVMRATLEKNGFQECGVIYLADGSERIAYEKIAKENDKMNSKEEKKRWVVATGNVNKLREIAEIFPQYEVISGKQAGFEGEVEETGSTFAENARLKAEAVSRALGCIALADDSGICVEALGGAPGVYSARYAGGHGDDKANCLLLLQNMKGKQNRRAYFQSAIALVYPDGKCLTAEGRTYGKILLQETGENGFGYDCIFESEDLGKSFGVASAEEKNAVSHRFRALQKLSEMLKETL